MHGQEHIVNCCFDRGRLRTSKMLTQIDSSTPGCTYSRSNYLRKHQRCDFHKSISASCATSYFLLPEYESSHSSELYFERPYLLISLRSSESVSTSGGRPYLERSQRRMGISTSACFCKDDLVVADSEEGCACSCAGACASAASCLFLAFSCCLILRRSTILFLALVSSFQSNQSTLWS